MLLRSIQCTLQDSERLIGWVAQSFESAAIALYEQVLDRSSLSNRSLLPDLKVNPNSAFGAMMCTNLEVID